MLTPIQWGGIANHVRSKLDYFYDPSAGFTEDQELREQLNFKHKGVYLGFDDGTNSFREGFLTEESPNVLESFDRLTDRMYTIMKNASIPPTKVHTGTISYTIITDVTYLPNPIQWNDNRDGIYFMWGQDYRALYLPYQIQKMNMNQIEVMDRLCSLEAGVCANLWRLPCGLVFRLTCFSHSS